MSTQDTSSGNAVSTSSDAQLIAQATPAATAAPLTGQVAAVAPSPALGSGLGVISGATPGVELVRAGVRVPVESATALQLGDRIIVPDGGTANVAFPTTDASQPPLLGVLSGGSDAVVGVKPVGGGLNQVVFEMASGDFFVAPPDFSEIESSVAVRKRAVADDDGFGWLLPLGLLGLAGLLGSGGGDDDNPPPPVVEPPVVVPPVVVPPVVVPPVVVPPVVVPPVVVPPVVVPPVVVPPVDSAMGFLDPTATAFDNATNALSSGEGALGVVAPVGGILTSLDGPISSVTDTGNGLVAPLVGVEFMENDPNSLDAVDVLVADLTDATDNIAAPLVDTLLGTGATESLVDPVNLQVDFVTDGVSNLLGGSGLLGVVGDSGAGGLLGPITGLMGTLGSVSGVTQPFVNVGSNVIEDDAPGEFINPVTDFTDNTTGNGDGSVPTPIPPISSSPEPTAVSGLPIAGGILSGLLG